MQEVWLPLIFSGQLLLRSTLFTTAVHLSTLQPKGKHKVETYRGEALAMLIQRLGEREEAVTDATIATVLFFIHESILTGDVDHTKTHMDGLEMMLGAGNSTSNPMLQEILFWTDLLGSGFTHTLSAATPHDHQQQ